MAALSLQVASASAAEITFDLTGTDVADYSTLSTKAKVKQDGLRLMVNAKRFRDLVLNPDGEITNGAVRNSRTGLFADGAGALSNLADADAAVDGFHSAGRFTDFLQLRFRDKDGAAKVQITSLVFDRIGGGGRIAHGGFFIVGDTNGDNRIGVGDSVTRQIEASTAPVEIGVAALTSGSLFAIAAPTNASWVLRSVTVSPVPLPAGGLLLLTGLGGLLFARRMKKRA